MAGGIQFVHFTPRPTLDIGLIKHIQGKKRPDTALEMLRPAIHVGGDPVAAREVLKLALLARKGVPGPKPNHCIDMMFTGAPPHLDPEAWSDGKMLAWAADCYRWACEVLGPNSAIVAADIHMDEKSPHLHILAIPVDSTGRLSWKGVATEAAESRGLKKDGYGKRYRLLQDHFHANVGIHHGLARGRVGGRVKQKKIDRAIGLQATVDRKQRAADQTLERTAVAGKEAAVAAREQEVRRDKARVEAEVEELRLDGLKDEAAAVEGRLERLAGEEQAAADRLSAADEKAKRRELEEQAGGGRFGMGKAREKGAAELQRLEKGWKESEEQRVEAVKAGKASAAALETAKGEVERLGAALETAQETAELVPELRREMKDSAQAWARERQRLAEDYVTKRNTAVAARAQEVRQELADEMRVAQDREQAARNHAKSLQEAHERSHQDWATTFGEGVSYGQRWLAETLSKLIPQPLRTPSITNIFKLAMSHVLPSTTASQVDALAEERLCGQRVAERDEVTRKVRTSLDLAAKQRRMSEGRE